MTSAPSALSRFFIIDTAPTAIYTLTLHDALPISHGAAHRDPARCQRDQGKHGGNAGTRDGIKRRHVKQQDRKSTRLNSSHRCISYAVFCLKKKMRLLAAGVLAHHQPRIAAFSDRP